MTIADLIITIGQWATGIIGIVSLFSLIFAGVLYLIAGGDEGTLEKARGMLSWGMLGFAGVVLSVIALMIAQYLILSSSGI